VAIFSPRRSFEQTENAVKPGFTEHHLPRTLCRSRSRPWGAHVPPFHVTGLTLFDSSTLSPFARSCLARPMSSAHVLALLLVSPSAFLCDSDRAHRDAKTGEPVAKPRSRTAHGQRVRTTPKAPSFLTLPPARWSATSHHRIWPGEKTVLVHHTPIEIALQQDRRS